MAAKDKSNAPEQGAAKETITVTVKRDGFRRAGREWHGTTIVAADELTPEQLERLQADSMFVVKVNAGEIVKDDA